MANIFSKIGSAFKNAGSKIKSVASSVVSTVKEKFPTILASAANGAANGGIVGAVGGAIQGVMIDSSGGDTYQDVAYEVQPSKNVYATALANGAMSAVSTLMQNGTTASIAMESANASNMVSKYIATNKFLLAGGLATATARG